MPLELQGRARVIAGKRAVVAATGLLGDPRRCTDRLGHALRALRQNVWLLYGATLGRPRMPRQLPPLNPLRTFAVAAKHLNFTRAAEELFVTAAAVSHQIKTLEESLGVELFHRQGNALMLTEAGRDYLPSIEQAFRQLAEATRNLHSRGKPKTLKVNVPPTFVVKWLIPRMQGFLKDLPEIDLKVSTSAKLVDFSRDDYDVDIRYGRGVYPGMRSELCLPVEVFPVCSPLLLEGAHPLQEPADLKYHALLHDTSTYDDGSNPDWAAWLRRAGVTGVDAARGLSFWPSHIVINAAIDGLGVALAKKNWVEGDLAAGHLVRPFDISLPVEFSYFLVYPESRADDPLIAAFAGWIRREVAKGSPEGAN